MKLFVSHPALPEEDLALWQRLYPGSAFVDIETLGLNKLANGIYLVGVLYLEDGVPVEEQYLAKNGGDERAVLKAAGERLAGFRTLISYNGDAFDLPYLQFRAKKLRLTAFPRLAEEDGVPADVCSVDLMRIYRPFASLFGLPDRKLKTWERFLGIDREDAFSGGQLIELFDEYSATGDARLEQVLLLHNYEDVANMPALLRVAGFVQALRTARVVSLAERDGRVCFGLAEALPLSAAWSVPEGRIFAARGEAALELAARTVGGELRYYLPDYQDYFYLPETAQIVHRSLADRIPAGARRKAKREECYLRKAGCFYPVPAARFALLESLAAAKGLRLRAYRQELREKDVYLEEGELRALCAAAAPEELSEWLRSLI